MTTKWLAMRAVPAEQHARWMAAAQRAGLTLSAWVRIVLDAAAEPETQEEAE